MNKLIVDEQHETGESSYYYFLNGKRMVKRCGDCAYFKEAMDNPISRVILCRAVECHVSRDYRACWSFDWPPA